VPCWRLQALAERDPHRAVPLVHRALETLQGHDSLVHAWAHYTLGWALLCWERFAAARPYLRAAQEAFEAQGALLAALRCRHAQLQADLLQFARPELEQEFATLAGQFVQAGAPLEAACVSLNQARLLYMLSRPDAAEAILARISPILAQAAPADQARLLRLQGAVANLRNAYARATELLTQAEHAFAALRYPCEVARCWLERAWVALRQEQLDQALVDYQRAERVFNRFDLPLQRAFCAKNIGLLMARRGAYDLALQSTLTALPLFRELQRTKDIGGCLLNLGNIYLYIAHWEAALACYDRAEAFYTLSGVVGERLFAQRNRAMVYRAQGWRAEALALLSAVEHQAQQLGNHAELAEVWHEQAALLLTAATSMRRSSDIGRRATSSPSSAIGPPSPTARSSRAGWLCGGARWTRPRRSSDRPHRRWPGIRISSGGSPMDWRAAPRCAAIVPGRWNAIAPPVRPSPGCAAAWPARRFPATSILRRRSSTPMPCAWPPAAAP
jgi:tetratricopeptide (TPR) repeat protein